MNKGIYTLILRLSEQKDIRIGALGIISFQPGYYIYTGSALGSGGLSRVSRHIRFYREQYRKAKWHIDYLMEEAVLEKTVCAETKDRLECVLAAGIGGTYVEKFGCSDCDCASHLFYRKEDPTKEVLSVFEKMGMHAVEHPILGSKK
ncbi:MAG TPA: GIY-YIG nuclease family protein [Methanocorpusculum sp.]|nr:GIY-YIG nuclease family protein [Methanocorpusculum sp.]